jgi:hypothetical protein
MLTASRIEWNVPSSMKLMLVPVTRTSTMVSSVLPAAAFACAYRGVEAGCLLYLAFCGFLVCPAAAGEFSPGSPARLSSTFDFGGHNSDRRDGAPALTELRPPSGLGPPAGRALRCFRSRAKAPQVKGDGPQRAV